ncbi:hypothetical protein [Hyalangium minutum]|uniref:Uncharacterized protein n=1 Tax=Hyalangium minutum TaxID=394096 RepID=A0A085WRE1_9BACT|nr:hypothetical protein [Hyalangium minutum]KFE70254.1 hypothetical protein DB31_5296 [Hyalangium minutum]
MRSIGREKELERVLAQIARRVDAQGNRITSPAATSMGSQVHISVEAPPRGGLSLFLEDAKETLAQRPGLYPVLVTVQDSSRPQDALRLALEEIARAAGVPHPSDTTNLSLFQLCEQLWESQKRVAVLMLDVTQALEQLHGNESLRQKASSNALLQRLRILVNDMEDKQPTLAAIVGWRNDFRERSIEWKAQDVEMRYYPHITLWPDFKQEDAWPLFESILRAQGYTNIDGHYPGFCRTGLTVGDILEELKQTGAHRVDGPLLLSTLNRKKPLEQDVATVPSDLLVALCLQDARIGPSHPLHEKISSPAVKPFVNPERTEQDEVVYVANEDLYRAAHVLPNRFLISTVRDYQRRFEDRDPEFALELLAGLPPALTGVAAPEVPQKLGGYAKIAFNLPSDLVPPGLKEMRVTAYCTLASEISNDLKTDLIAQLNATESTPLSRATQCVLVLHSEAGQDSQLHAAVLSSPRPDWRILQLKKGRLTKDEAAALCTIDIKAEQATELAFKKVDPSRQSKDLSTYLQRQIRTRFNSLLGKYPALDSQAFDGQHLPRLMVESHTFVDLATSGDDVSETAIKVLENLQVVERKTRKELCWAFEKDMLLKNLLDRASHAAGNLSEEMSRLYTFDPRNWPSIAAALATAYSDFLEPQGSTLREKPPQNSLTQRVRIAFTRLDPLLQELRDLSAQGKAVTLEHEREELDSQLTSAQNISSIELICEETLALVEKGKRAVEETQERRDQLVTQLQSDYNELERRAPDPSLSNMRSELSKKAKQILARQPPLLAELEEIQRSFETYRAKARAVQEKLQTNLQDAALLRQHIQARRTTLENLEKQAAALDGEAHHRIQEALRSIHQQLDELHSQLGDEKKHPSIPPDAREKELITIRTALDTLASQLQERSRWMVAPRKAPAPRPATSPQPAPPSSAAPQPSAGGGMSTQPSALPPQASPAPRDDTHRPETSAPPVVAAPASGLPKQLPSSPPVMPVAGTAPTPPPNPATMAAPPFVPQGIAAAPPPETGSQASQSPIAPVPELPQAPPETRPAAPRERRTLTFMPTPEDLRVLAEFLDTQPHIVHFNFEPPQS